MREGRGQGEHVEEGGHGNKDVFVTRWVWVLQEKFRWSGRLSEGVEAMIVQRLRARGRVVNGDRRKRLREYDM